MMKTQIFAAILFSGIAASSQAVAQAQVPQNLPPVLEITQTSGGVIVEMPNGKQAMAKTGMQVPHAAKLLILENGSATGKYLTSKCEIQYKKNTVVNVRENAQCAPGIAVIDADKYAKFGSAGNDGCCVTRTITLPATRPVAIPTATTNTLATGTSYTPYVLGGIAGVALLAHLLDDDDDNDDKPLSR